MLQHMSTSSTNLKSTNKVQPHVSCVSCRRVTLTWQEDSQWSSPQSPPNNNSKPHLFATIKWLLHFVVLPLASCSFRVKQKSRRGWLSFKKGCCNFVGGNHWNRLYNRYHEYYITNNHTVVLYIEYLIVAEKKQRTGANTSNLLSSYLAGCVPWRHSKHEMPADLLPSTWSWRE